MVGGNVMLHIQNSSTRQNDMAKMASVLKFKFMDVILDLFLLFHYNLEFGLLTRILIAKFCFLKKITHTKSAMNIVLKINKNP